MEFLIEAYLLRSDYARAKLEGAPTPDQIRKRAGRLRAKRLAAMRAGESEPAPDKPASHSQRGRHKAPNYVWCAKCRAYVTFPCIACQARAARRAN